MTPGRGGFTMGAALLSASCAAVWGFDDAVLGDAAAPDARAIDASAAADTVEASLEASTVVADASTAPTCSPACGASYSCARAVGGDAVCVASSGTCTDSAQCMFSSCCVWVDSTSGTGRCQAPIFAGSSRSASCLCTSGEADPAKQTCRTCVAPAGDPTAPVRVCSGL